MAQPLSHWPKSGTQEPDPQCIHCAPNGFFNEPRINDPRTDFFAVYRKESEEFDRDYVKKCDEELNTTIVFAGLFSGVSVSFIGGIQPLLGPDPNEMTAVYMQILIHTVNNTLFPDVDPSSTFWTGPDPEIVVVQSLLYASLMTSLFAAFLAMLGKQWVNHYLRSSGGSTADKSRDRQQKLDGHERWYFYTAIESLPMMLQFALILFGCALSLYLYNTSPIVAWIIIGFGLAAVTVHNFFTLTATLYHSCPYRTIYSIFIGILARYLKHGNSTFARSVRYGLTSLVGVCSYSAKKLRQILKRLRSGVRSALQGFGRVPNARGRTGEAPLAAVGPPNPNWFFGDISVDREAHQADARCISWILDFTTDSHVIFYGARFATEIIWYPEIAGTLSPHILAKPFVECLSYGRIIPNKLEEASVVGMALASILSIQFCIEPEREDLQRLSENLRHHAKYVSESEPKFWPGVGILMVVLGTPDGARLREWDIFSNIPDDLPTTQKLCLSRVILQTVWRWRRVPDAPAVFNLEAIDSFCRGLMANRDHSHTALKIHCLLIMVISLGHQAGDIHALFTPDDDAALQTAILLFHNQLLASIEGNADRYTLTSVLSALIHLDLTQVTGTGDMGYSWITAILDSDYPEDEQYRMASHAVRLLGKQFDPGDPVTISVVNHTWVTPLVRFLSLCEKFHATDSPPHPGIIALRILSTGPGSAHFDVAILPILTRTLLPTHPLQSRDLALKIFHIFRSGWLSLQMQTISDENIENLLQAVGDPFQLTPDLPPQDGSPAGTADYNPMMAAAVLIEFASSDRWKQHLRDSNFTSCEEIVSTEEGIDALKQVLDAVADEWLGFTRDSAKITATIGRLRELQCLNTVEVVITWAQAAGVGSPEDHETWRSIRP